MNKFQPLSKSGINLYIPVPMAKYEETRAQKCQDRSELEFLLVRVASGDRKAFRKLYDGTARAIYGAVLTMVRSSEMAREITQEVYVSVWQKAGLYNAKKGSPLAWMFTVARNRALDRLRAEGVRRMKPEEAQEDPCAIIRASTAHSEALQVRQVLERLQPDYRRALVLAYYYGYTHEELASQMGVPLGTAKSWVRRGLLQLRDGLSA
ncbi:MAG: sigma-70 family RNA polymerase sigma factor [Kiloniellales bacterium]|nr:sigma-70 family RNA polymerase sigma factor [Kiloniellales bacterium]